MLVSTVIVEALDLIDDAEAKEKRKKRKKVADQSDSMDIKRIVVGTVPIVSNIYSS
jgi:hypothetical protein